MHWKNTSLETNGYIEKGKVMITRQGAIEALYKVIDSGILSEELEEQLTETAKCIEAEDPENDLGVFLWGADDDYVDLYIAKANPYESSEPYNTEEMKKEYDAWLDHCSEIFNKYRIKGGD